MARLALSGAKYHSLVPFQGRFANKTTLKSSFLPIILILVLRSLQEIDDLAPEARTHLATLPHTLSPRKVELCLGDLFALAAMDVPD